MKWTTACTDWERRIVARESLIPMGPLFPDQAAYALGIFGALRMVDAAGSPLMCETVRPWVNDFVGAIFGAYDQNTGRRMITEFLLLISKKNGKSTIAAGIMVTAMIVNWRTSGEYLILAPTKEIADNSYIPIRDMINADDELKALFKVQDHIRTVTHLVTGATLKVVAADSDTVSGKKAIGVFIDELWVFGKRPGSEAMLREATGGLASRPEGFVIYATTQSDDPPAGVFKQKLQYARQVRDGEIDDPSFLPMLFEFPQHMLEANAHRDPENAYVTNPNLGLSVDVAFIKRNWDQALASGEESLRGFLAKHLNVEIGLALRSDRWVGAMFWEPQARKALSLALLLQQCEIVCVGVDGGGLDDLLGLAVLGRVRGSPKKWMHWAHAWVHESALELRKSEAPRLRDLEAAGDLTIVEHVGDDIEQLVAIVAEIDGANLLDKVGLDPAGIGAILDSLAEAGIDGEKVTGISQGWKLTGAIKTLERKLAGKELEHCGQPLMDWACGNAKGVPSANAFLVTKQASGTGKIDPLMALFNAVFLLSLNPQIKESLSALLSKRGLRKL